MGMCVYVCVCVCMNVCVCVWVGGRERGLIYFRVCVCVCVSWRWDTEVMVRWPCRDPSDIYEFHRAGGHGVKSPNLSVVCLFCPLIASTLTIGFTVTMRRSPWKNNNKTFTLDQSFFLCIHTHSLLNSWSVLSPSADISIPLSRMRFGLFLTAPLHCFILCSQTDG